MVEMTRRIVQAVRKPVTVKTRLGWDDEHKNIEEIALRLQDAGIAALTIHGRTRAQMYRGEADWTLIGKVKNNPQIRIPIIGNGDVDSGFDHRRHVAHHPRACAAARDFLHRAAEIDVYPSRLSATAMWIRAPGRRRCSTATEWTA